MNSNVTHDVGMVGSGVTLTSAMMTWFGENASAIGAIITVASFILTAVFLTLNYMATRKTIKINEERLKREIVEHLQENGHI